MQQQTALAIRAVISAIAKRLLKRKLSTDIENCTTSDTEK